MPPNSPNFSLLNLISHKVNITWPRKEIERQMKEYRMYERAFFFYFFAFKVGWVSACKETYCLNNHTPWPTGLVRAREYRGKWVSWFICIVTDHHHHHHQVPDLEQTLAAMPIQTSLSSDNFKKFKPLLCPPVAELQRLSRNVILCLPLSRLPSTFPVKR